MIPLKTGHKSKKIKRGFPFVNILFILICIGVFVYEIYLSNISPVKVEDLFYTYGVIPDLFLKKIRFIDCWMILYPYITSVFLHGGWLHIIGNMLFLAIFGGDVERSMGHIKYFFFFILCGIASGLFHTFMNIHSSVPTVGASGAIAGVLGAYFIWFPKAKITTIIPLIFVTPIIEIPAIIFLGAWFLFQFLSGTGAGPQDHVAWWAHIGGFVIGIFFALTFFKKK
ncbi:MAG: rhomboid family intramembrane serine protease [Armatimonadota bacterium]